jgi:arylsulfatase A-like enzyme
VSARSGLVSGSLAGALLGLLQVPALGDAAWRLAADSQIRSAALAWLVYALLGLGASLVTLLLARGRWPAAGALAAGLAVEVLARVEGLAGGVGALSIGALAFFGVDRAARRLGAVRSPALWAALNLLGLGLTGAWIWATPAAGHGVGLPALALAAAVILLPSAVLARSLLGRRKRSWRTATALPAAGIVLALVAGAAGSGGTAAEPPAGMPNVLLLTLDTLRADHLGCYGNPRVETPAFDTLAAEGIRVETALSPIPLTNPAHTTLLTGFQPAYHGVTANAPLPLRRGVPVLPEVLAARGYRTAAFVSGVTLKPALSRLFERFEVYDADFSRLPGTPESLLRTSLGRIAVRALGKPSWGWHERFADATVSAAEAWLGRHDGSPFFLWVHLYDPHGPYLPPSPFDRMYDPRGPGRTRGDWYKVPLERRDEVLGDAREVKNLKALYAGEVSWADRQSGRLLSALREAGLLERTLVVLTSDHGESLTEHGYFFDHSVTLYEPSLRVPLIFRLPGGEGAGRVVPGPASLADVAPTVLDLLGLPVPRRADGRSLRPALEGAPLPDAEQRRLPSAVFPGEIQGGKSLLALRTARHKYVRTSPFWADHLRVPGSEELYDLEADPGEARDLAFLEPELLARFRELAEPLWRDWMVPARSSGEALSGSDREALRSLGYLQ